MRLRTFLELGRTSNIPTVWTNVLCGAVVSEGFLVAEGEWVMLLLAAAAGSAFYLGGMMLNDAFDVEWDREHRKDRPIVRGEVSRREVYGVGFGLLALGLGLSLMMVAWGASRTVLVAASATCIAVVAYDRWHKQITWAPVLMGACRAGLYCMGASAVTASPGVTLWTAAAALWAYVVGLTHIARFESGSSVSRLWVGALVFAPGVLSLAWIALMSAGMQSMWAALPLLLQTAWSVRAIRIAQSGAPGSIPRAVVSLIAGLCLVDATLVAFFSPALAVAGLIGFGLTLRWQRSIAGT